jgi:hypothetical protein
LSQTGYLNRTGWVLSDTIACTPKRKETMAVFTTLRSEMCACLERTPLAHFDSLNFTYLASERAERLSLCMDDLALVGSDFLYGRSRVNYLRNHTWAEYGLAADRIGSQPLDDLFCSAGAVNMGVYGNKLVLKHAWQVRCAPCAFNAEQQH